MNVIRDSFALLLVLLPLSVARAEDRPALPRMESDRGASAAGPDSAIIHWRPAAPGVFGDPNPFFWKGEYHVFYAFTMRGYDFREGKLSLEVSNGRVRVLEFKVKTRQLIPNAAPAPLPSGGQK